MERAFEIRMARLGENHIDTVKTLNCLEFVREKVSRWVHSQKGQSVHGWGSLLAIPRRYIRGCLGEHHTHPSREGMTFALVSSFRMAGMKARPNKPPAKATIANAAKGAAGRKSSRGKNGQRLDATGVKFMRLLFLLAPDRAPGRSLVSGCARTTKM